MKVEVIEGNPATASNPALGTNGQNPAPASSLEVGFIDGAGALRPLSGTSAASGPNVAISASSSDVLIGPVTETAPATDTASSGLNGRLQRIAQRLTSLIALLPVSLGQKTMSGSLSVTLASDQTNVNVSQNGNTISTNNSSVAALGANATFTGVADDVSQYRAADVYVAIDQNGTLFLEGSSNGTNWDQSQSYALTVTTPGVAQGFYFQAMTEGQFFRIRYTNGATIQGVFRLQTILKKINGSGEVQPINQAILGNTDAAVTKGVLYGLTTGGGGGYVAVKVTPSGALAADVTSNGVNIATETTQVANGVLLGPVTETAPATDTASSGLNGRLQRIAQRLTSLIALLPASLGQKTMAGSLAVTLASDQTSIPVSSQSVVNAGNSTVTPLLANATFTGTTIDTLGYTSIWCLIASDQASSATGVQIQYSGDGTNWDEATVGSYTPGTAPNVGQTFGGGIRNRYARLVYTNGAVNQTAFRVSTVLRSETATGDIVDMDTTLGNNTHGVVTKSVITGRTTAGGGSFVDVKVNPSGTLTVDASNSTGVVLGAGTAIIGKVGIDQTTPGTTNGVQVNAALPAGANLIGYIKKQGLAKSNVPVYNIYSSTNVTTAAYVQLIASTTTECDQVEIFDSSGNAMILAVGAAASEVDQLYVPPGGGSFNLAIPAGSRVAYKALTANATSGYLLINLLG